jgi:hypothetical protein
MVVSETTQPSGHWPPLLMAQYAVEMFREPTDPAETLDVGRKSISMARAVDIVNES